MSRRIHTLALGTVLLVLTASGARADQIISTDLYVTATSDLTLSSFSLDLALQPVGFPAANPYFLASQPDPYTSTDYVFFGQSLGADGPSPFWSNPFPTISPPPGAPSPYVNGEIIGGDVVDGSQLGYVTLTAGQTYYLGTVQYDIPGAPSTDTFQVALVTNSPNTYFQDQNSNNLTVLSYAYDSGVQGQLITISGATSVPEPSSVTMLAISSGLGAMLMYRRRRATSVIAI